MLSKILVPSTLFVATLSGLLLFGDKQQTTFGAPTASIRVERSINPEADSLYWLGTSTKAWKDIYTDQLCLTGDVCRTTWPSGSGGAFPFTPTTNYNAAANSTSTPVWFTAGLMASTTANYFDGATIDAFKTPLISSVSSAGIILEAANGTDVGIFGAGNTSNVTLYGGLNIDGTTRLATSLTGLLKATAGTISVATAGTDYANFAWPFTPSSNFNAATNATGTPLWLQGGVQASSTSYISLLRVPAGSTSAVPVGVAEDSNTGIYSGGNDILGLVAGGVSLLIDGNGTFYPASSNTRDLGSVTALWRRLFSTYASTSAISATAGAHFGATATSSFNSAGVLTLTNLNGPLQANAGIVSATTSVGILYGGTGLTAVGASSSVLTTNGTIMIWQSIATYIETTIRAASLVLAGAWDFGGATGLEIPNGSAPTVDAIGEIALDTTSNLLIVATSTAAGAAGTIPLFQYPAFTYATSTAWTGTTTIPLGTAFQAEYWTSVQCFTDAGTLNMSFYDGTNRMNMFNASTTAGTVILSTNNTFTAAEKRYVDIGTPATSPTKISCTIKKAITRD